MKLSWTRLQFLCSGILLLTASALFLFASNAAHGQQLTATEVDNELALTISYHTSRTGAGTLTVELLDPEGKVLSHAERIARADDGDGEWQIRLDSSPLPRLEDLVWERIRYKFTYDGERAPALRGIRSVSEILRRPVVHILGQNSYLAGGPAAIRILLADPANHPITGASNLRIELLATGQPPRLLFSGNFNRRGTVTPQFRFPAELAGKYQLRFLAETSIGTVESTQPVRILNKVSILLTTEKPIYQPGQTIHIRALALDRADHRAAPGPLTFEVQDSRGNKVFKKATETDGFGIASAEFTLADEVNLGTYHVQALMGNSNAPANSAGVALTVDRYVLPKFKVSVNFAEKDGRPRRDYRPSEHVTGTIHASYFFGKPLVDADVTLKGTSMDVVLAGAGPVSGRTDKDGNYKFDLQLPFYLAGQQLTNGMAPVLIEATVKDTSGHAETRNETITVSQSALLITAAPEGGKLIPGLENEIYLLTSYPDGSPAAAQLTVKIPGAADQMISTDKGGVGVLRMTPHGETVKLAVDAADAQGNHASAALQLDSRNGLDQVLLRANRAIYKVGDRVDLSVLSTTPTGSVYIDVVKDGQTILTRDVDLVGGRADLAIDANPEMAGTLDVHVYRFGKDSQAISDHRIVFVQPAGELRIEAAADAQEYKPGGEARVRFHVTDEHGDAVQAALGLQVVDEAVFALAEKQPGFAKVFFYLEQELLKPRYEIHSFSLNEVVEESSGAENAERDRAAHALFAAMEMNESSQVDATFGRDMPRQKMWEYRNRYQEAFQDQVREIAQRLSGAFAKTPETANFPALFALFEKKEPLRAEDAWGTPLRLESAWDGDGMKYYRVVSAGADRQFDTGDDLAVTIETRTGNLSNDRNRSSIRFKMEHDIGAMNGLGAITGSVSDATGAVIPQASVTLSSTGAKDRKTTTDAKGKFTFAALFPGQYAIRISAVGFNSARGQISLQPRDQAIATSVLAIRAATEAVRIQTEMMNNQLVTPRVLVINRVLAAPPTSFGVAGMEGMGSGFGRGSANGVMGAIFGSGASQSTHVRSYFPEALYIDPEILTDGNGNASVVIPVADSITTWRMAMLASTKDGVLGTGTSSLKVFQDFFVDLDLPVTLTQGDRVSIPVAIYNYAGARGNVKLALEPDAWFSMVNDSASKTVAVDSGQVGAAQFTLQANRLGKFKLTLAARMTGQATREDVVVREIEVVPNGREQDAVVNGRLDAPDSTAAEHNVQFPAEAIPDATKLIVRLYPGPLSQVIEGMDSLLRMPFGCFEQTSSTTYPNVLALDYMKRTKKLTPEVHAKAEGYIATGYQRLLTFEVPGGGFSWFGTAPANKILTAYGLMEFSDMAKVYDVDPRLIERTRQWLISQQQPDGSWKPDTSFINEGATNRYNSDLLRITAYIAWALGNTGYRGPALEKAEHFVAAHQDANADAYTLAVLANFAVEYKDDDAFTRQAMSALVNARTEKGDQAWWSAQETGVYATGESAAIETTGLAAQALLKWHQSPEVARKALAYIAAKKQASGAWGTTQATIMALRALLLASQEGSSDVRGTVELSVNGKPAERLDLTPENNDLFHQFVLSGVNNASANHVQIRFAGSGSLAYQVVGRYFLPWDAKPAAEPLSIDVSYDRTKLVQNDTLTETVLIRNNTTKIAYMVMVDLGIPPGFDLMSEDLEDFRAKTADQNTGRLEKFNMTATQAVLYFNGLEPETTVELHLHLRAKYPIRARTFESKVYEYYDPAVNSIARPVQLEVSER
jgi:uncharacterized protein YfaS (alpha-2-macroglobulin family)